jgi:hypothetical protein
MGIFFTWNSSEYGCQLDVKWKGRTYVSSCGCVNFFRTTTLAGLTKMFRYAS